MNKQFILSLFTLLSSITCYSQNFELFKSDKIAQFDRHDNSDNENRHYLYEIKFDSVIISETETIFYPKQYKNWLKSYNYDFFTAEVPSHSSSSLLTSWIGKKVVKSNTGNIYKIIQHDNDTLTIDTEKGVGESWQFSTGVTATVNYILVELILPNIVDTVKVIQAGNRTLKISKNHGIIQAFAFNAFPENETYTCTEFQSYFTTSKTLNLVGINIAGYPYFYQDANDFFSYEVGDFFKTDFRANSSITSYEYTVTGKVNNAFSTVYTFHVEPGSLLVEKEVPVNENLLITVMADYTVTSNYGETISTILSESSCNKCNTIKFHKNLGGPYFSNCKQNYHFSSYNYYSRDLVSLIKNGAHILSNSTPVITNSIALFPNPSSELVEIQSDHVIKGISAYNSSGQLVFQKECSSNTLNISKADLGTGIFNVLIETVNGHISKKIIFY